MEQVTYMNMLPPQSVPYRAVCPSFPARKIDVGPSAPPMIEIAAAALSLNPKKDCAQSKLQKIPN